LGLRGLGLSGRRLGPDPDRLGCRGDRLGVRGDRDLSMARSVAGGGGVALATERPALTLVRLLGALLLVLLGRLLDRALRLLGRRHPAPGLRARGVAEVGAVEPLEARLRLTVPGTGVLPEQPPCREVGRVAGVGREPVTFLVVAPTEDVEGGGQR